MSFQAQAWAHGQKTGGPSARVVLWSIANYANDDFLAWPKQQRLADDSEQSPDSVGKRIADLIDRGLVRRIKLKRFGRRTHDLFILPPSAYFAAPIEEILPLIPAGCDLLIDQDAAADSGSVDHEENAAAQGDSQFNAAAGYGSESGSTLPQSAVDATALVREPNEPVYEPSTPTQTLPHEAAKEKGQPKEEAAADSGLDDWLAKFKETYPIPDSRPELTRAEAAKFTAAQRDQCLHGAAGVAEYQRKNPKARGLVGPLRFVRSSALWAEFSRFAPAGQVAPPPRVWVEAGSDEWRARAVLHALVHRAMPEAKSDGTGRNAGADFLGSLPPSGLALAQYANELGDVDIKSWVLLTAAQNSSRDQWSEAEIRDYAHIRAWVERVNEICGVKIAPGLIILDELVDFEWPPGVIKKTRKRHFGLRVPAPWPPPKGPAKPSDDAIDPPFSKTG